MIESDEKELAALLILENKLVDARDKIIKQLEPARMWVNELIKAKRAATEKEVNK